MFNKKKNVDMTLIRTSSKDALKRSLMQMYQNDVDSMRKMYEFYMQDMGEIPDFDPVKPTPMQQAKETISSLFSWADQNQDKLIGAYNMFRSIRSGQPINIASAAESTAGIPPLPPQP